LLISASFHAAFMGIRIGKGIEVWFVQMLMLGAIIAAIVGVAAIYLLAAA
jgi:VIT1/CCC1 family predicted Fe2+/Mn2+ transporter